MYLPKSYEHCKTSIRTGMEEEVPLILSKMAPIQPASFILDYGCGPGDETVNLFLPLAEATGSRIHAVDISPEMIEYAKKSNNHPQVVYFVGDILDDRRLFWKDCMYDRIFATHVFHYIQDYKTAIAKLHQLLKPSGEFGFTVVARLDAFSIYSVLAEHPQFKKYMQGIGEFIPSWYKGNLDKTTLAERCKNGLEDAASQAGFEIVHSELHYITQYVEADNVIELYLSLNPFTNRIPTDLWDELRQVYRTESAVMTNQDPAAKAWVLKHDVLSCVLRKPQ